ncbi:hypothetical protein ACP70R_024483 [Stipagrostis hirtigluma subsp. patula]
MCFGLICVLFSADHASDLGAREEILLVIEKAQNLVSDLKDRKEVLLVKKVQRKSMAVLLLVCNYLPRCAVVSSSMLFSADLPSEFAGKNEKLHVQSETLNAEQSMRVSKWYKVSMSGLKYSNDRGHTEGSMRKMKKFASSFHVD